MNKSVKIIFFSRYLILTLVIISFLIGQIHAQQSNTLFFMHSLPESNYINPATQIDCGLFVGLPVFSSIHLNSTNYELKTLQEFSNNITGEYQFKLDLKQKELSNQNNALSELHAVLLSLGMSYYDYYFTFSITEKNNQAALYTDDLATFYQYGNSKFGDQWLDLYPSGLYSNHLREYALGTSKIISNRLILGIKAKLLFGKLNLETDNSQIHLYTQENSNDILFDVDIGVNSSMPLSMHAENPNEYRFYNSYNTSLKSILMSGKNPGMAMDIGFIYELNDHFILSGSILDLGFIKYRKDLTNYSIKGNYFYEGEWGNNPTSDTLAWGLFDELNENNENNLSNESYFHFLDPRLYLGASYKISNFYKINVLLYNRFFPNKIQTGGTISLQTQFINSLNTCISWSYMNNSLTNFGIGIDYRHNPYQAYLVSDNILGVIMPNTINNVNIRIGFNLFFGCNIEPTMHSGWSLKNRHKFRKMKKEKERYRQ